jgi:hypothetical protein
VLPSALLALAMAASGGGCPAPIVQTERNPLLPPEFVEGSRWIAPGAHTLYAVMWAGRAVDGRFSVYAGGFNPVTGINEKIMWVVPARRTDASSPRLRLVWRLGQSRFVQVTRAAGASTTRGHETRGSPRPRIYPSVLRPPREGCWRLAVNTGRIRETMHVIVTPPPVSHP